MARIPLPPGASKIIGIAFGAGMGVFSIGLVAFLAFSLWPRGERVGAIDLRAGGAPVAFDASAGDGLTFRLDVTLGTAAYAGTEKQRESAARAALRSSSITATVAGPDGAVRSSTCPAYDGKAVTSTRYGSEVSRSGAPLTCALVVATPGRHVVTARAAWATGAEVRAATLEVRREAASK